MVRNNESSLYSGLVIPKEFTRSLLGRIRGTRHLVRYTGKFVISGVRYIRIPLYLKKRNVAKLLSLQISHDFLSFQINDEQACCSLLCSRGGFQVPFADKVGEPSCICGKVWKFADSATLDGEKLFVFAMKLFFEGGVTPHAPSVETGLMMNREHLWKGHSVW